MAQDINLLGGIYLSVPAVILPKNGGGLASFTDVSDTTATADDVINGKYFYTAAGVRTQGTGTAGNIEVIETPDSHGGTIVTINGPVSGGSVVPVIMRPDAELVTSVSYDKYIHEDEGVTIPAYTSTAKVLLAAATLSPTVAIDTTNYNYYVLERGLTIPEYSVTSVGKGRVEYSFFSSMYEIVDFAAKAIKSLINPNVGIARSIAMYQAGNCTRLNYYSSTTAIASYSTASYGTYQTVTAPTANTTTLTLKSPAFGVRGHTTYFTNTYFNAVTDIRYQYVIDVYRAPKDHLSFDGWPLYCQSLNIIGCADSSTHKLV